MSIGTAHSALCFFYSSWNLILIKHLGEADCLPVQKYGFFTMKVISKFVKCDDLFF